MPKKKKRRGEIREVPLEDIKQGPLRHKEGLTPLLEELARSLFARVGHFVYPTFEQWELGFLRDMHPWREILVWEVIARAFDRYVAEHPDAANNNQAVGTLVSISTGQVSEHATGIEEELCGLYKEAYAERWDAPPGEPFEFPRDEAVVLQFADIVDKWNSAIHPNLRGRADPRRILADADIIVGKASKPDKYVCIYGQDCMEAGRIPEGMRTLVVSLDIDNEKAQEWETICAIVQLIRGRQDSQ